jgi:hypothetical protein
MDHSVACQEATLTSSTGAGLATLHDGQRLRHLEQERQLAPCQVRQRCGVEDCELLVNEAVRAF